MQMIYWQALLVLVCWVVRVNRQKILVEVNHHQILAVASLWKEAENSQNLQNYGRN